MRDPIPQPLTIDGLLTRLRNAPALVDLLGLRGIIVMWSGALADVPPGWAVCDGTQGTPDLRDRFVVGARADYAGVPKATLTGVPTQSGGSVTHSHPFTTAGHLHGTKSGGPFDSSTGGLDIVSAKDSGTTGGPDTIPVPYYALAFLMKL